MKLVIAEKPSVAQSLAAVIGATARKDGYLEGKSWNLPDSRQAPNNRRFFPAMWAGAVFLMLLTQRNRHGLPSIPS